MIKRINQHRAMDILEFVYRIKDNFQDFYITSNKNRIFIDNFKVIKKILKSQEYYIIDDKQVEGCLLIYREKNYRPYIKLLCSNIKYTNDLLKYLAWNFSSQEMFAKVKRNNPLAKILQKHGFIFKGNRGNEILLYKPNYLKKK